MVNKWFSVQFLVLELSTHKNSLWVFLGNLVPCVGKMAERIIGLLS